MSKKSATAMTASKPSKAEKRAASPSPVADVDMPAGKKALLDMFAEEKYEPTRVLKSTSSATPTVTVEAMVFKTNTTTVKGKKEGQMVPKLEIWASASMIRHNGAPDYIDGGLPGMGFLLPSHRPPAAAASAEGDDDGPEAAIANKGNKDKKATDPPRTVCLDEKNHKTIWLGMIRTSVYTQGQKGETKEGVDLIRPGMVVEIAGNVANLGADGKTLWLNASRVTPLRPEIAAGTEVSTMIRELYQPDAALASTFIASQCAQGFFGADFAGNTARETQAEVIRKMWSGFIDTTAKECEGLAMTLRSEGTDDDSNAKILDQHATRIKGIHAHDIAAGNGLVFLPTMMPTEDRPPFCCPLVQHGKHPAFQEPTILMDMVSGTLDNVPKTFCALDVKAVQHQGATLNIIAGIFFVADRDQAMADLRNHKNPVLSTGKHGAIGIKLNMREFCGTLGSTVKEKAEMAGSELLLDADMVPLAKIVPKPYGSDGVRCVFPDAFAIDMPASIPKVAMPVTEGWVQKYMCGGNNQFVYEKDVEVPHIKDQAQKDVNPPLPQLKSNGYQAISESGFKFALSKAPIDRPVKAYCVLFSGCRELMAAEGSYTNEEGEKAVAAAAGEAGLEIAEFLLGKCIVYCVARIPGYDAHAASSASSA